jgi:translation initiation factor IF-1
VSKLDSFVEAEGTVEHAARDIFRVACTFGAVKKVVTCRRAGRLQQRRLAIVAGDRVTVLLGVNDLTQGRITKRLS